MKTSNQFFIDLLHSRDLKATNSRLELLVNMQQYENAMPFSKIQKVINYVDRVTLYRTIETLSNQGIIHQAYKDNNEIYYALCGENCNREEHQHEHIHFKCKTCKSVTCQEISKKFKIVLPEYEIHQISIHVNGICKKCNIKKG